MDRRVPEIGFSGIIRNQPKDKFQKLFGQSFVALVGAANSVLKNHQIYSKNVM